MFVIDRFEGEFAVCEDLDTKGMMDIPRAGLPPDAREGDVIVKSDGVYSVGIVETAVRRRRIHEKMKKLWQ